MFLLWGIECDDDDDEYMTADKYLRCRMRHLLICTYPRGLKKPEGVRVVAVTRDIHIK